ncbi:hypothetical protein [Oryzobacter terrae]|uniref:hypothetical protein n=1 Tax=Oryzobacter terrae TaxID=1620385 RepID=UPI00366BC540
MAEQWEERAARQHGVLCERDLRELGVSRAFVRNQLRADRWAERTHSVYTTTTGPLSRQQLMWTAVAHAGPSAMIGGLTAAALHGLRGWDRDLVTVLVDDELSFAPVDGISYTRTRRAPALLRAPRAGIPTCRLEPAVLMFAADEPSERTALGAVVATVQLRLTTTQRLAEWTRLLRPLRRAPLIRELLGEVAGGSHSMGEVDLVRLCRSWGIRPPRRQTRRRDRSGRVRFTDAEWDLPDGRVLVLEVDGGAHLDLVSYGLDVKRQRRLTTPGRVVIRCTTAELRHEPLEVVGDLMALGVPRLAA